jgi:hypothetical protein
MDDIPFAQPPKRVPGDIAYPSRKQYSLQWLAEAPPETIQAVAKNNTDAAFKKDTREPTPSELLLHYIYGAAAVKMWGHGREILQRRTNIRRPAIPTPAPMGPGRVRHDKSIVIQRREAAQRADQSGGGSAAARDRGGERLDAKEEQAEWDEHDVMLFSGETRLLRLSAIVRARTRVFRTWSSGGEKYRHFQSNHFIACFPHASTQVAVFGIGIWEAQGQVL